MFGYLMVRYRTLFGYCTKGEENLKRGGCVFLSDLKTIIIEKYRVVKFIT